MKYYIITFRSVTYAQRGERILNREGIRCSIQRTPKQLQVRGCGYSLRLWMADVTSAVELLKENGVNISRIFTENRDGTVEEVML